MNMKKSLAGVMAGAMAVSAMATVVSADQDAISLTYDLKTYLENTTKDSARVTVVANYADSKVAEASWDKVSAYDDDGNYLGEVQGNTGHIRFGADNVFVTGGVLYEYGSFQNIKTIFAEQNTGGKYIDAAGKEIDFTQDGWGNKLVKKGVASLAEFEFTARPYKDLAGGLEETYSTFKATGKASVADGSYWTSNLDDGGNSSHKQYYDMPITSDGSTTGFNLKNYNLVKLGYTTEDADTYAVRNAVAKLTYVLPAVINVNAASGWGWDSSISAGSANNVGNVFLGIDTYKDVKVTADLFALGFNNSGWGKNDMIAHSTALVSKPETVAVGAFTEGTSGEQIIPFKSTLNPEKHTWTGTNSEGKEVKTEINDNDVVAALQQRKTGGKYYTKPVAVLNDAIANHDNVVFTFTSYNGYVATEKSHLMNQWVNVGQGYDYETSGKGYDWHNPNFGQHLYTNLDDAYSLFDSNEYDMYGSYSSAWAQNLFTGAVVVNSGLTMQLSDTDKFEWGNNTLSFDWFDITDEGKITDAKTFLTSMLLYTPVDWYWDTLTVVVSDDEDEAIDAGEGLDGEGDVIDDEEPADEAPVEEEPTEEVVEEPAETEAAPVETAPSPATGNAPVALAVIPVALAAAAVVAKKRG